MKYIKKNTFNIFTYKEIKNIFSTNFRLINCEFKNNILIIIFNFLFLKIIIITINLLFIILIYSLIFDKILVNHNSIKLCLCTLGKNENKYALEFIEHYKKYGVDKIFIYHNNDINGEKFEDVLNDYIKDGFVEIINYRGKYKIQLNILNHCYYKNYKKYNWLILFDMDEFIFLKNYKNIKYFLNNKKFYDCQVIYLNEVIHLDNNQLYYKNKKLSERFKEIELNSPKIMVKSILRGDIENINITNNHVIDLNLNLKACN